MEAMEYLVRHSLERSKYIVIDLNPASELGHKYMARMAIFPDKGHYLSHANLKLQLSCIGHEGSVGLSVCKVHISATRWRLFNLTAVALRFCRATEIFNPENVQL
jgi:hypothetical protein